MNSIDLSDLVGGHLTRVYYDLFVWNAAPHDDSILDEVPLAVILGFDTQDVILRWDLRPPVEQLVSLKVEESVPGPSIRHIDVSGRWSPFLGSQLIGVSWAEQETSDGFQPWAVTLMFGVVGELVIALGELMNGVPTYIPDSLIVTASRRAALSYQPTASPTPAWTKPNSPCA